MLYIRAIKQPTRIVATVIVQRTIFIRQQKAMEVNIAYIVARDNVPPLKIR